MNPRPVTASRPERNWSAEIDSNSVLELLTDAIIRADNKGGVLYANAAAMRLLGSERAAWDWSAIGERLGPGFLSGIKRVLDSGAPGSFTVETESASQWLEVRVLLAPDASCILQIRDAGTLVQAQRELNEAETERDLALQAGELGVWRWDAERDVAAWSATQSQLFGLPPAPFSGPSQRFLDLVHPQDRSSVADTVRSAIESNQGFRIEFRVVLPDEGIRWLVARGASLEAAGKGRVRGLTGVTADITERRRELESVELHAKRRVARALRRFRDLFDEAPIPYHEIDSAGRILRVNHAECELLGRRADEMVGHHIWEFVSENERAASRQAVLEKLAGVRPLQYFTRDYTTAGGRRLTLEIVENLIRDDEGRITGIRTAMIDVTDRRRSLEQAKLLSLEQAARAEIHGILERIGDAYIVFDRQWRYAYVNQKAAEYALKSREALIGRCVWDEFPEAVNTRFYTELQRSLRDQVSVHFENWYAPLGRWFENTVYPSPEGVSVYYRDITERKMAEKTLAEKTEALARSNSELEQFAYIVSHDLQEPLRTVASYTALLAQRYRGRLDENAEDFIRYAVEGVERMRVMIDDLLALCRLGHISSDQVARVEMSGALHQALLILSAAIEETGAQIEYGDLPVVAGVESHLIQVWQNLIGNALKYRSAEAPQITIRVDDEGSKWRFSVSDNGAGFDMKFAERIFRVFKRLDVAGQPGSGVGLAICKKIVERHGGLIWAESEPGKGSTFFFTLPKEG